MIMRRSAAERYSLGASSAGRRGAGATRGSTVAGVSRSADRSEVFTRIGNSGNEVVQTNIV